MENVAQLLKEELRIRQTRNPNFSLRAFARWLQLSPAHLSQVMSGKRPVTLKMAEKIASRLGLSPVEKVHFLKSTLPDWVERNTEPSAQDQILPEDRFRLISDWYHFAILNLTKIPGAQSDPRWIARRLGISPSQATEATTRLVRMGLLQLKPTFKRVGDPLRVASTDIPSEAIRKFHKQTLDLAAEKVDTVDPSRRDLNAITMSINASKLPLARKLIDECLTKVSAVLESGTPTEVYTLSMQLFPLTQPGDLPS